MQKHKNILCLQKKAAAGFTIVEALVAMTIIALIFGPVFTNLGGVLNRVTTYAQAISRIIQAQNFIYTSRIKAQDQDQYTAQKKIDTPAATLAYSLQVVDKKSSLHDFQRLFSEKVTISYTEKQFKRTDALVNFVYRPKPPEKK